MTGLREHAKIWIHNHPFLYGFYKQKKSLFLSSFLRVLPNFLIIGAQKSASTSLYDYISQHPCVSPVIKKELNFFSVGYQKGFFWYRSNFPTIFQKYSIKKSKGCFLTGEADPTYIIHPWAPKRVREQMPGTKLILILRNPIDRAYSHFNMIKNNLNIEPLSFEDAIKMEEDRLSGELEKAKKIENYDFLKFRTFSYLYRGLYSKQIKNWLKFFSKRQLLVISTEALQRDTTNTMNRVFNFLQIPPYQIKNTAKKNVGKYDPINPNTRQQLIKYFKPHNDELFNLLGERFDWDK